jgi:glycosyltransferase involved in cell wall biosynthesis
MSVVLVPVYQPGSQLADLLTRLRDAAPDVPVVVVDDGSGTRWASVLDTARHLGATVVENPKYRGKGIALKTGFAHIARAHPGAGVVCADADGQHSVPDILAVAERVRIGGRMVLGVREFTGDVPLRRRVGNTVTRMLFRAATGRAVRDTQTGLRGYPAGLLDWLGSVPGERFEYEMNVLLRAARDGQRIDEVVIATTYLADNASSHFGGLTDSARVYAPLLRFAAAALIGRSRP